MTIGDVIKKYREEHDLSQRQFALKCGISNGYISMLERGENPKTHEPIMPSIAALKAIASAMEMSLNDLLMQADDMPVDLSEDTDAFNMKKSGSTASKKEKAPGSEPNAIFLDQQNVYMIPLYETVSAGLGAYAINNAIDYIPLYINTQPEAEETICIKVAGDSMFPKIEEGDIIQVHKQDSVDSGTIAVILLDGEKGLVKRIEYGENWIELHSINPEFQTRRFEGPAVQRIQVVGAVKKIIKSV